MLIKKIILSYNVDLPAVPVVGNAFAIFASLDTRQGEAAMPALQDNGSIYFHANALGMGGDGATAAEGVGVWAAENGFPTYVEFDDPIPVADDEISFYLDSVNMDTAVTAVIKIYYAIAEVGLEDALTILESYR